MRLSPDDDETGHDLRRPQASGNGAPEGSGPDHAACCSSNRALLKKATSHPQPISIWQSSGGRSNLGTSFVLYSQMGRAILPWRLLDRPKRTPLSKKKLGRGVHWRDFSNRSRQSRQKPLNRVGVSVRYSGRCVGLEWTHAASEKNGLTQLQKKSRAAAFASLETGKAPALEATVRKRAGAPSSDGGGKSDRLVLRTDRSRGKSRHRFRWS
jgi:hypothetical protein